MRHGSKLGKRNTSDSRRLVQLPRTSFGGLVAPMQGLPIEVVSLPMTKNLGSMVLSLHYFLSMARTMLYASVGNYWSDYTIMSLHSKVDLHPSCCLVSSICFI